MIWNQCGNACINALGGLAYLAKPIETQIRQPTSYHAAQVSLSPAIHTRRTKISTLEQDLIVRLRAIAETLEVECIYVFCLSFFALRVFPTSNSSSTLKLDIKMRFLPLLFAILAIIGLAMAEANHVVCNRKDRRITQAINRFCGWTWDLVSPSLPQNNPWRRSVKFADLSLDCAEHQGSYGRPEQGWQSQRQNRRRLQAEAVGSQERVSYICDVQLVDGFTY